MAIIASGSALSVSANSKSLDQVTGTYQYLPYPGGVALYARASATGLNVTMTVNGFQVVNDQPIAWTGTAGGLSRKDHGITALPLVPQGSRVELTFRNTTGGAITTDFVLELV